MDEDVAIKVDGVYKDFKYSSSRSNTLKSLFTGFHKSNDKSETIQHALKDISFEIKKGEFFGIVGRNGSGKSTLLKIIAGIYQPNKGSVKVSGKLVPFIELGVGFNPELTGRENVYMNGALLGFSTKEIDDFYKEVVEFAELEKFMDKKLKNYSSGMQVRLAFSMAIRAKADVLLIDEVLAVGDADFQRKCFEYFKKLKKDKTTVVFVSHDMEAIKAFCDEAVLIENSKLISSGPANIVAEKYSELFMLNAHVTTSNKDFLHRRGEGQVVINRIKLNKYQLTSKDEYLTLELELEAKKKYDDLMTGFTVTDSTGLPICGRNSEIVKVKIPKIKVGQKHKIIWRCPNIFSDGTYSVAVSTRSIKGKEEYDFVPNAAEFIVKRANRAGHVAYPAVELILQDNYSKK